MKVIKIMPHKQKHLAFLLSVVWLSLTASLSFAASTPQGAHGTIALVPLEAVKPVQQVTFLDQPQLILGNVAVVGIPLFTDPGEYAVNVSHVDGTSTTLSLKVLEREYPEERITITDQEQVTPSTLNLERIRKESALMREAYALFTPQPDNLLPIIRPVEGRTSGVFGSRRFFNDQPRNPHSGIDWAAPLGTPIKSPAPGKVVVVGSFFFNGNTVLIDHGGGFISMMCHLDEIHVEQGVQIEREHIIGTVGSTGRSTGPHLHWSVSLSGQRTDPEVFMRVVNALYESSD